MPHDEKDRRWIDEHIERPQPEIASDAVLAERAESGVRSETREQAKRELDPEIED